MQEKLKVFTNKPIFIWLVFLALTFLIFGRVLNISFLSDDWHWLWLARESNWIWQIFLSNYEGTNLGGSYSPLLLVIYKILWPIFGLKYQAWHAVTLLLHATNAFLIYYLARRVFSLASLEGVHQWSILTAVLFLIYPVHVETIAWLAAWPHPWALLFYLLALISYFKWRHVNKAKYAGFSLLFFTLSFLIKEIAISLPLLVLVWEIYFFFNNKDLRRKYFSSLYFILLGLGLYIRYLATGLVFGYYGQEKLDWPINEYIGNLGAFFNELITLSWLRVIFYKIWYHYLGLLVAVILIVLAIYFYILFKKKEWLQMTIFSSLVVILGPLLPLGLHRSTFAGERYLYLAASFFVIWLIYLLAKLRWSNRMKVGLFMVFALVSLITINYKLNIWQASSDISQNIINSYQNLNLKSGQKLASIGLPDNLSGAELFRNNLAQALEFYYPNNHPNIISLPVYVQLNLQNQQEQLLEWRDYQPGWLAESADGGFVVTGITSIERSGFYFELWNYNYQNYTANVIRLIPNEDILAKILSGEIKLLSFDQGELKIIK